MQSTMLLLALLPGTVIAPPDEPPASHHPHAAPRAGYLSGAHHPCLADATGRRRSQTAVVDSGVCVRGTTGLRVVDAPAFPRISGYFIVSAVYRISEKAADVIIETAK